MNKCIQTIQNTKYKNKVFFVKMINRKNPLPLSQNCKKKALKLGRCSKLSISHKKSSNL